MKHQFTTRAGILTVLALLAAVWLPPANLSGGEPAAATNDGIRVGQFELPYSVGGKAVFAEATLEADGTLRLTFPSADGLRVGRAAYRLTRVDVGPGPGPVPVPIPVPVPAPDTKANFVYVIRESRPTVPDLAFAKIANDKGWRDTADALKVGWKLLDQDSTVFQKMPAPLTTARAVGLPAAVFIFPDGASKGEKLAGKTPADLDVLIKKYGGTKP